MMATCFSGAVVSCFACRRLCMLWASLRSSACFRVPQAFFSSGKSLGTSCGSTSRWYASGMSSSMAVLVALTYAW